MAAEADRLRKERDANRAELDALRAKGEESISTRLRLLSVELTNAIRTEIFSTLKWVGGLIALAVTVATAGGYFTLSSMIASTVETQVKEQVREKEEDIKSVRTSMFKAVADFTMEANKALNDISTATGRVKEASANAEREIRIRVTTLAVAPESPSDGTVPAESFTIPVVVNVVYSTDRENISDEQIKSQITVLNDDYHARNADLSKVPDVFKPFIGDARIRFELATKDPAGRPTIGITRTKTTRKSFSTDDAVKSKARGGADAWDTARYLNIWVATLGAGVLNYAQLPGGPKETDGVVVHNVAFGTSGTANAPFNKGRTATSAIAQYLNLRRIWGDGQCVDSDLVADTPIQQGPNFGKPTFPHISCNNGPNGDMFMNFMDYVDDDIMYMFTKGQVQRMHETLQGPRKRLIRQ